MDSTSASALPAFDCETDPVRKTLILRGNQLFCEMLPCDATAVREAVALAFIDDTARVDAKLAQLAPNTRASVDNLMDRIHGEFVDERCLPRPWLDVYAAEAQRIHTDFVSDIDQWLIKDEHKAVLRSVVSNPNSIGNLRLHDAQSSSDFSIDFLHDPRTSIQHLYSVLASVMQDKRSANISFIPAPPAELIIFDS